MDTVTLNQGIYANISSEGVAISDINSKNSEGNSALHIATVQGNIEKVRLLLQHGAEVNVVNNLWLTPLHYAVNCGWNEIVQMLLDHGAKVNALNNFDFTPLHYAANQGEIKIAKLLIEKRAPLNIQNMFGQTPLHCASNHKHFKFNCEDCRSQYKYCSVSHGRIEVVKLLIEKGAKLYLEDEDGCTALDLARNKGFEEVVNLLEANKK